tara:strand:+ start:7990 stop:8304 length:315 start_codon:yes stop_codon:yes gene_type:complete
MKLTTQTLRTIIREELEDASEVSPTTPTSPTSGVKGMRGQAAQTEIKKAIIELQKVPQFTSILGRVNKTGSQARVNFAVHLLDTLELDSNDLTRLHSQLTAAIK